MKVATRWRNHRAFINAIREVLDLDPLYDASRYVKDEERFYVVHPEPPRPRPRLEA